MSEASLTPLSQVVLDTARLDYLQHYDVAPRQFSLRLVDGHLWEAEFRPLEAQISKGFVGWFNGKQATEFFFNCDPRKIHIDEWDDEWSD